jgi:hypothetical protein
LIFGVVSNMQILCKASDTVADVRCTVCGQAFLIYWTRSCAEDRSARAEIQRVLCSHHQHNSSAPAAHPPVEFSVSVAPLPGYFESLGAYA